MVGLTAADLNASESVTIHLQIHYELLRINYDVLESGIRGQNFEQL